MTAKRYEVAVARVRPFNEGLNRKVSVTLKCGLESFVFHMPERIAADLLKQLRDINPREGGPVTKL